MTWKRLSWGHVLAMVAALALLFAMAPDWWTDKTGQQDRFIQHQALPDQFTPSNSTLARAAAESHEKNAWQATAAIDRVILVLLLAAAAAVLIGGFVRAYGRKVGPPSPMAIATVLGLAASVLLTYRILQPPGLNDAAVVKWGAPLALLCVGVLTMAARVATLREAEPEEQPSAAPPGPAPDAVRHNSPAT
jgi:hypothetical protein